MKITEPTFIKKPVVSRINVLRLYRDQKTLSEIGKILGIHPSRAAKMIRATLQLRPRDSIVKVSR